MKWYIFATEVLSACALNDSIENAIKNMVAKAVVPSRDVMFQALSEFGAKVFPPKRILKIFPELFDHQDQNVGASSKGLTLEHCCCIGKDPKKELVAELVNVCGTAKPSWLRQNLLLPSAFRVLQAGVAKRMCAAEGTASGSSKAIQSGLLCIDLLGPKLHVDLLGPKLRVDLLGPKLGLKLCVDLLGPKLCVDLLGPKMRVDLSGPKLRVRPTGLKLRVDLLGPKPRRETFQALRCA
ncbi:hypothetical protein H6P81_014554 [Aristolochia fimbriata]|uniref:XMAP215/Dis1/CLASP TOG domain-containing protein n=1 Tax=Aristolochia fimbriata TaxID=158543 RepID=A0AAV7EL59_ARIFI|nr:hypothetical protein H6P81_014554 [Aristolochia fimbriata]